MKDKGSRKTAKIICGIIVVAMIAGIIYLTLQTPEQTTKLSETVRMWLKKKGWEMTPKEIRSFAHIPLFFLLGFSVFLFGHVVKWKWSLSLLFAFSLAIIEECIKVFLPTREFDFFDFVYNFIGIIISWVIWVFLLYFLDLFQKNRVFLMKESEI